MLTLFEGIETVPGVFVNLMDQLLFTCQLFHQWNVFRPLWIENLSTQGAAVVNVLQ